METPPRGLDRQMEGSLDVIEIGFDDEVPTAQFGENEIPAREENRELVLIELDFNNFKIVGHGSTAIRSRRQLHNRARGPGSYGSPRREAAWPRQYPMA
ncbi:hypothetical protein LCGC14_1166510 [marine sediment metagenome]|uniref:Uncharacterized protein n=1 Tax=marine sediment metagenome TaxID=412755 RepID=A0A0F9PWK8_9ZZZZ